MLLAQKDLAPKTINNILQAGTVALGWAADNDLIPSNPAARLRKFSGVARKRGVLTPGEAGRLFSVPWAEERSRVANLLAMTTGLRAGEILALRVKDIAVKFICVRHSWSYADGLKSTKTNMVRTVPLLPVVRSALISLIDGNPWGSVENVFVFYSVLPNQPMDFHILLNGLRRALVQIGIDEYQNRGLGALLIGLLIKAAHESGIEVLRVYLLDENRIMIRLLERFAAQIKRDVGNVLQADLPVVPGIGGLDRA